MHRMWLHNKVQITIAAVFKAKADVRQESRYDFVGPSCTSCTFEIAETEISYFLSNQMSSSRMMC